MTRLVSPSSRASSVLAVLLVLAPVLAAGAAAFHSRAEAAARLPVWTTQLDVDFSSTHDALAFATTGPGRWRVHDGALVLSRGRGASTQRASFAVISAPVQAADWRARLVVRRLGSDDERGLSLVVVRRSAHDYVFVRIGGLPSREGVFQVRRGATSRLARLARLDGPVSRGRLVVQLEGSGRRLGVQVDARRQPRTMRVKDLRLPAWTVSPGLVDNAGGVALESVRVRTAGNPPPPPVPLPDPTPSPTLPAPAPAPLEPVIGLRNITVTTSAELTAALAHALPGDAITMADGVYTTKGLQAPLVLNGKRYVGTFVASVGGTAANPIVLQGSPNAVIDGKPGEDGTGTQYGLYLADADHWWVRGITVRNVSKGVVLDESDQVRLEALTVHDTGQEGIHLRAFSSDNVVSDNVVTRTGMSNATYGEGIYVGSANSNWGNYSGGQPDASDRNVLLDNDISHTGAESMDIKEGTTGGRIEGNTFDGAGMTGSWADSWIDLKGNAWTVVGNHGVNALEDGFQVHGALPGWGSGNVFMGNTADVRGPGYGFWLQNNVTGNTIQCDNVVVGAASGFANTPCSSAP